MPSFLDEDYLAGSDLLGSDASREYEIVGAETGGGPFVTIHVKDVPKLVQQKGGQIGGVMASLLPSTIEGKVYGDLRSKLESGLKAEGVDAEVKIVSTRPFGTPYKRDFLIGMGVGAGVAGLGYGLVKLVRHFFGRK